MLCINTTRHHFFQRMTAVTARLVHNKWHFSFMDLTSAFKMNLAILKDSKINSISPGVWKYAKSQAEWLVFSQPQRVKVAKVKVVHEKNNSISLTKRTCFYPLCPWGLLHTGLENQQTETLSIFYATHSYLFHFIIIFSRLSELPSSSLTRSISHFPNSLHVSITCLHTLLFYFLNSCCFSFSIQNYNVPLCF